MHARKSSRQWKASPASLHEQDRAGTAETGAVRSRFPAGRPAGRNVPSKLSLDRPCDTGGPQRAALGFILVTVALDMLAMAIVIPVLLRLVLAFLNGDTARAAGWFGLFGTI
jgi:hypothetical protein